MFRCSVLFILTYLVYYSYGQYDGAFCYTPNNEAAVCLNLMNCPILLNALTRSDAVQRQFLHRSLCGFTSSQFGSDPLVCCGTLSNYQEFFTSRPPTIAIGQERVVTDATVRPITDAPWQQTPTPRTTPNQTPSTVRTPVTGPNTLLPSRGVCGQSESIDRIIGGENTTLGEFPWMVLLGYRTRIGEVIPGFSCGGALITNRYVITAAHCIVGEIVTAVGIIHQVRLGEYDQTKDIDCLPEQGCNLPPTDIRVEQAVTHEGYQRPGNARNRYHDIALLRLVRPVEFTEFITPICLPTNGEQARLGEILFVAGWGSVDPDGTQESPVKMKLNLTMVDQTQCTSLYSRRNRISLAQTQFCAGGVGGRDSCRGDSGGPIMRIIPGTPYWYIEGVVSFGPTPCGQQGLPGIYTRVAEYLDWIRDNMRP